MADPRIDLTVQLPSNMRPTIGELILDDPTVMNSVVVIRGRYMAQQHSGAVLERFLDLRMRATANDAIRTSWGTVLANPVEVAQVAPNRQSHVSFQWQLSHADLEAIERYRDGNRYITFNLALDGLAFLSGVTPEASASGTAELHAVQGEGQMQLSVTEWEDKVLTPLGYKLPPSWDRLLPNPERREHPAWAEGERRLADARKALRHGQSRAALGATLDAFESAVSQPYSAANWRAKFMEVPEDLLPKQKREAVADMLGGLCTYLNRVGHHRGRSPDPMNALAAMPADQWEAEHVVAAAHFLLPLALRLVEAAQPVAVPQPPGAVTT